MKTVKHVCGCVSRADAEREQWITLCEKHEAEFQEIHQRAMREHAEQTQAATEQLVRRVNGRSWP